MMPIRFGSDRARHSRPCISISLASFPDSFMNIFQYLRICVTRVIISQEAARAQGAEGAARSRSPWASAQATQTQVCKKEAKDETRRVRDDHRGEHFLPGDGGVRPSPPQGRGMWRCLLYTSPSPRD